MAGTFAEQEFKLAAPQRDGTTLRDQLENAKRQGVELPEEYRNLVELPEVFTDCWVWFLDLHNSRTSGMAPNPITYSDIHSYFSLHDIVPEIWEVKIIKMFDQIAMKEESKRMQTQIKNKKQKSK